MKPFFSVRKVLSRFVFFVTTAWCGFHSHGALAEDRIAAAPVVKSDPAANQARIKFEDLTAKTGIRFELKNSVSPQRYSIETMLGGVAVFDYNNDGLLDIFFTNGASIPSLEKNDPGYWNRLYRNNGDGTFTDVTEKACVRGVGYSMGVAAGDYDNDGFVDLYVTGVNRNQLLHNNRDGTFSDVTEKAGVSGRIAGYGKPWAVAAGWFDARNSGHLDLIVINYLSYDVNTAKLCSIGGARTYCAPGNFAGTPNVLYRNNGDGSFTDISRDSHIGQCVGKGMGLAFGDYDNDGRMDVFVSNDTFPNFLLHNNGDGTFREVALEQGLAYTANGSLVAGMGSRSGPNHSYLPVGHNTTKTTCTSRIQYDLHLFACNPILAIE
jgi:enediyne biosynthesis protein E4